MPDTGLIDLYLKELREALRFPPPLQERILAEVEDHLSEGAERGQARGLSLEAAQQRGIARFGSPERMAAWLAAEYMADVAGPRLPRGAPLLDERLAVSSTASGGTTMWQKFTERARRVIYFSQEEAARCAEIYVGTEHLLLGLAREYDSVAAEILLRMGISPHSIIARVVPQLTRGSGEDLGKEMQLTSRSKRSIDLAYEESQSQGLDYIGTEHLLLGLIREGEGLGAKTLIAMGAGLERIRQATAAVQEQRAKGTPDPVAAAWRHVEEARRRLVEAEAIHSALLHASAAGTAAPSPAPPAAASSPGAAPTPSDATSEPPNSGAAPEVSA
jgi:Clp amino terminal domain, pathogenicity island component/HAAS